MKRFGNAISIIILTAMCAYMAICTMIVTGGIIHSFIPFIPIWIGAIIGAAAMIFTEIVCFGIFVD